MSTTHSLILFDFDDTLADTERHMPAAFYDKLEELLRPHYPPVDLGELMVKNTELYRIHGSSIHGWMHELGKDMDFTLKLFADMAPTIRDVVMPHMVPDPRLHKRLKALQSGGHTLAILTLGHRDYCLPLIEKLGLNQFFPPEMVFDISVMEGRLKRHEDTFKHLLKKHLTSRFRHLYMLEDSMANLMAAKKAGFTTLLINPRFPPKELASAIDHHSQTVTEALDYLIAELLPA